MPNQANRSSGSNKSSKGQTGDPLKKKDSSDKPNPERSDVKHGTAENDGNTNRTSSQGRKTASGGDANE